MRPFVGEREEKECLEWPRPQSWQHRVSEWNRKGRSEQSPRQGVRQVWCLPGLQAGQALRDGQGRH